MLQDGDSASDALQLEEARTGTFTFQKQIFWQDVLVDLGFPQFNLFKDAAFVWRHILTELPPTILAPWGLEEA
jgi:hypothetical protein